MSSPAIFICYSHQDENWKDRLVTHLRVLRGSFNVWSDNDIGAGEDWYGKIHAALGGASLAVLLVSAHSLTSKFILNEEVARLLERRDNEGLRIFPIIIRECPWKLVEWLARMQVRPKGGRPLEGMTPAQVNKELSEIVQEIAQAIRRNPAASTESGSST